MKKLLLLSYYFPPLGLGGTQRVAKFVKYLPQFDWQPTVVTVRPIAYWALDDSLMKDVEAAEIIRTESFDPQRLLARLGRTQMAPAGDGGMTAFVNQKLLARLLLPDSKILWSFHALREIKRLTAEIKFDAIMTTSPPHSVHLIGRRAAHKYHLPWIADFRDGWAGSHIVHEPSNQLYRRNLEMQSKVVKDADAVITCSPGIEESLCRSAEMRSKFFLITNGFDPADFQDEDVVKRDPAKFTLCYSGTINKWANPQPFLRALAIALKMRPGLADKIRVVFVGLDTLGQLADQARQLGLSSLVQIVGHQPHDAAVAFLQRADALLLLVDARASDTFIPGKTFEYIGARRPLFVVSNSKFTNDLLRNYRQARIVETDEPQQIAERLLLFVEENWASLPFDDAFISQFDRRRQTARLAEILNSLIY
jgi:glycosyltransferase involved in cell wall biosynthesis